MTTEIAMLLLLAYLAMTLTIIAFYIIDCERHLRGVDRSLLKSLVRKTASTTNVKTASSKFTHQEVSSGNGGTRPLEPWMEEGMNKVMKIHYCGLFAEILADAIDVVGREGIRYYAPPPQLRNAEVPPKQEGVSQ